ncbi:MAG: hypothetical protein WBO35_05895 [Candidatus Saccharimonadales bacterium]
MAEGLNLSREDEEPKSPETDDDEEDSSSSKTVSKKSVGKAGLGGLFKSAEKTNNAPKEKELRGFDRLFEAFKVDSKAEKPSEEKELSETPQLENAPVDTVLPEVAEPSAETYELSDSQLGGGEFIIDLHHNSSAETVELPMPTSSAETSLSGNEVKEPRGQEAVPGEIATKTVVANDQETAAEEQPEALEATADPEEEEDDETTQQTTGTSTQPQSPQPSRARATPAPRTPQSAAAAPAPSVPPVAPTSPAPAPATPAPTRPPNPNQQHYYQNVLPTLQANPNLIQTNPNAAPTAADVDDAEYYARRQGRREGLFAGLVVGGGVEHIRHKRREKRMEKNHAETIQKHEKLAEDAKWDRVREKRDEKPSADFATKFTSVESPRRRDEHPERPVATTGKELHELRTSAAVERMKHDITRETTKIERAAEVEYQRRHETIEVPEGHRVERSAWHTVELDEHGRPVENSVVEYGQEYYNERAHETAPVDKTALKTAAASAAMAGATASSSQTPALPAGTARTPASSSSVGIVTSGGQAKKAFKAVTSPPTTPTGTIIWGGVLLVILIILSFIIF